MKNSPRMILWEGRSWWPKWLWADCTCRWRGPRLGDSRWWRIEAQGELSWGQHWGWRCRVSRQYTRHSPRHKEDTGTWRSRRKGSCWLPVTVSKAIYWVKVHHKFLLILFLQEGAVIVSISSRDVREVKAPDTNTRIAASPEPKTRDWRTLKCWGQIETVYVRLDINLCSFFLALVSSSKYVWWARISQALVDVHNPQVYVKTTGPSEQENMSRPWFRYYLKKYSLFIWSYPKKGTE